MDVLFIRHGKAGERDPSRWPDDDKRPLTTDGVLEARDQFAGLRKVGVEFEFLVTSPLARAKQTAEVIAELYERHEPPQESDVLGHDCSAGKVVALLNRFPPDSCVALVGHEPDFSRVTAELIGRSGDAAIQLKKGGVACVSFEGPAAIGLGELAFLYKPSHLRRIGKATKR